MVIIVLIYVYIRIEIKHNILTYRNNIMLMDMVFFEIHWSFFEKYVSSQIN